MTNITLLNQARETKNQDKADELRALKIKAQEQINIVFGADYILKHHIPAKSTVRFWTLVKEELKNESYKVNKAVIQSNLVIYYSSGGDDSSRIELCLESLRSLIINISNTTKEDAKQLGRKMICTYERSADTRKLLSSRN